MPCNGLALAVGVCCEIKLIALLQLGFKVSDLLLLVLADDVERGEVILRVNTEACPGFLLVLGGDVGGAAGKVPDVADGGLNDVLITKVFPGPAASATSTSSLPMASPLLGNCP